MVHINLNLSDPFIKALKAVNSWGADNSSMKEEDLKKQRTTLERAAKLATPSTGANYEEFELCNMKCAWCKPDFAHNTKNVILYCHGGGYTAGGIGYAGILATKLAISTGLETFYFEYRLAPENKYPAALDDGMAAWNYLMHLGYGAKNVIVAGDSAGGNMALELTQKIIAEGRIAPRALVLFSPWTDMTATADSFEEMKDVDPIVSKEYVESVRKAYIGEGSPLDPKFSPLYGSFKGFPPTLVQVGKNEILQDDSTRLVKAINKASGQATLDLYKEGWHVFQQMPVPVASKAMDSVGKFVNKILYTD